MKITHKQEWLSLGGLLLCLCGRPGYVAAAANAEPSTTDTAPSVLLTAASPLVVRPSVTGRPVDFATLQTKAAQGNADAQYQVGIDYLRGEGVSQDDAQTAYWLQKAAAAGIGPAECDLGYLYETGRGVPKDYPKAAQWYGAAAAQGIANSQYNLGLLYVHGYGVPKDYTQALKWFRVSAVQKNSAAEGAVGFLYAHGMGVPRNDNTAVEWYRRAGLQGDASAEANLGSMYLQGRGVIQDYTQANYWFRLSAAQGIALAQAALGLAYLYGPALPPIAPKQLLGSIRRRMAAIHSRKYSWATCTKMGATTPGRSAGTRRLRSPAVRKGNTISAWLTSGGRGCHRTWLRPSIGFAERQ